ncbi:hypothetical protein TRP8649_00909 [Pelagimonas phthalicica]|uniref:Tetratricopeptide repeat protein n=1 Tax=Pelagimonas phthalicica TaxID=1037362 RepID=A0A238J9F6_9RHOB|nr:tetratricopeptide repeat protein [Pelagimonas phthalicica]TDS94655.1 hypothetical protein CLV87_1162 [Pelagimonas phthalicica]SMX26817.1 hypothetical protein TRP8649_00909 [Pelagimonas phthalicica]
MNTVDIPPRSRMKTWAYTVFIIAFLCLWLSGMTAGLMAGACRNDRYEGEKKLRFCNISLTAAAWMRLLPVERTKRSIIHLERGIALAQMGRNDEAIAAFKTALQDAREKRGSWEKRLHQRMVALKDPHALPLWVSVVQAAE